MELQTRDVIYTFVLNVRKAYLLLLVKLFDLRLLQGPIWHTSAVHWSRTLRC